MNIDITGINSSKTSQTQKKSNIETDFSVNFSDELKGLQAEQKKEEELIVASDEKADKEAKITEEVKPVDKVDVADKAIVLDKPKVTDELNPVDKVDVVTKLLFWTNKMLQMK